MTMDQDANQWETFHRYAETELENHQAELATRYQNRELSSAELQAEALAAQRGLFEKELTEKMEALLTGGDSPLRSALEEVRDEFLKKLK